YIFDLLDSVPEERADTAKPPIKVSRGEIELRDVHFGYRDGDPVLDGVSFVAAPGQTTALVGLSGAGKSTIMSLIERFWDPTSGSILIDGTDIATVSRNSLRNQIAYMSQETFMFSGTLRENIELGKQGATDAEIVEAAKS